MNEATRTCLVAVGIATPMLLDQFEVACAQQEREPDEVLNGLICDYAELHNPEPAE